MHPQAQTPPAAAQPKAHEHDTLVVTNIDTNCADKTQYTVERSIPVAPVLGETNPMNIPRHQSQMQEGEFDHAEFFEVRYAGTPFRIAPGQSKEFPRYIAEHYAKHLADHVLQRMELEEERAAKAEGRSARKGLVQSNVERPKVLSKILQVKTWFLEGQQLLDGPVQVDPNLPAHDIGAVPNYAMGDLKPEPKSADQILAETDTPAGLAAPTPTTLDQVSPGPVVEAPGVGAQVTTPTAIDNLPPLPPTTAGPDFPPPFPEGGPFAPGLPAASIPLQPATDLTPPAPPNPPTGERTKPELIREAVLLGIEVNGRESVEDLKQKISAF